MKPLLIVFLDCLSHSFAAIAVLFSSVLITAYFLLSPEGHVLFLNQFQGICCDPIFFTGLLLCRCCVAAFTIASFISVHLSSTFPCPFLLSNCCWMVSRYSPRLSSCWRSSTSKHLLGLPFALLFSFRCRDTITKRWSLSMSPPLYTLVSITNGLTLCLTRIKSLRLGLALWLGGYQVA